MANVFTQMKDLYKLQSEAKSMQKKLREQKICGESEDGRLKLYMNGAQEFEDIEFDATLLDPEMDILVKKAFREAFKDYQKKLQKEISGNFDVNDLKKMLGQ